MSSNDHFVCPPITTMDAVFLTKVEAAHELAAEISRNKQLIARIEVLEAALLEIMEVIKDQEWDTAPPQAFEIARAALDPACPAEAQRRQEQEG